LLPEYILAIVSLDLSIKVNVSPSDLIEWLLMPQIFANVIKALLISVFVVMVFS